MLEKQEHFIEFEFSGELGNPEIWLLLLLLLLLLLIIGRHSEKPDHSGQFFDSEGIPYFLSWVLNSEETILF